MQSQNNNFIEQKQAFGVSLGGLREVVVYRVITVVIIIPN